MSDLLRRKNDLGSSTYSLVVVGRSSLQNNLLARLLELDIGEHCVVSAIDSLRLTNRTARIICLLDVGIMPTGELEKQFECLCNEASVFGVAIINADPSMNVECLLRWPKVQGLFYRDTTEEQFVKGVRALLRNECWLPRKLLARHLEHTRGSHRYLMNKDVGLTRKEIETLRAMATGARNSDIADILHVSPHTVKTHVYNVFKKINVCNRVQAVSWAIMNLDQTQGVEM